MERAAFSLNRVFLYSSLPVAHTPSSMNQRTGKRLLFSFFLVVFFFSFFLIDYILHFSFLFLCCWLYVLFCFSRHRGKVLTHSGVRLRVFLFFFPVFFFSKRWHDIEAHIIPLVLTAQLAVARLLVKRGTALEHTCVASRKATVFLAKKKNVCWHERWDHHSLL